MSGNIGPSFTFSPGGYGTRVLPKLGQIDLSFDVSPNQFDFSGGGQYPRLFGGEGTGCFYGLSGSYTNYLTWGSFLGNAYSDCFQFSGFNINALGVFNTKMTLPDPNTYGLPQSNGLGSFPSPLSAGASKVNQTRFGAQFQSPPYNFNEINQQIRFPNVSFQDTTGPFVTTIAQHTMAAAAPYGGCSIAQLVCTAPFVIEDDFGNYLSATYCVQSWQYGSTLPPARSTGTLATRVTPWTTVYGSGESFNQGAFNVAYLTKNGVNCTVDLLTVGSLGANSIKVNPQTGVFFLIGGDGHAPVGQQNGLFTGNVIVPAFGSSYSGSTRYYTTLEDPTDQTQIMAVNSQFNLKYFIQQCPGGGFLCFSYGVDVMFLIKGDLSGYYRLNCNFKGNEPTIYIEPYFGMDTNGFIYLFDYSVPNPVIFSTLKALPPIMLTIPQISLAGTSCRRMSCAPWEG